MIAKIDDGPYEGVQFSVEHGLPLEITFVVLQEPRSPDESSAESHVLLDEPAVWKYVLVDLPNVNTTDGSRGVAIYKRSPPAVCVFK